MTFVLIAEDDPDIADALRQAIADRTESETAIVANGALVPDALVARRPDLLILDVALPGLNGLDVFALMRGDPRWQGVPVLFLTGLPDRAQTATAPLGVHEVLAKPFDIDELIAAMRRLAGGRGAEVAA